MPQNQVKLKNIAGEAAAEESVLVDFRQARKIESVRLGKEHFFFKSGTAFTYVPYKTVTRIFKRIEPVGAKLACCRMSFDVHRIVLCQGETEVADVTFQDQREADFVMGFLEKMLPEVLVGVSA